MKKDIFNGIILPFFFERDGVFGNILGIVSRELGFGPEDIKVNAARLTPEKLSNFGLVWLENCPEFGPYSNTACCYWMLPSFSKMPGTYFQTAIRARPTEEKDGTPYDHDFIFWSGGQPASIGHQYGLGREIANRLIENGGSLKEVTEAWQEGACDLKYGKTIGELNKVLDFISKDSPNVQFDMAKRKLEIKARDATWQYKSPLLEGVA